MARTVDNAQHIKGLEQFDRAGDDIARKLPRYLFNALAAGLFEEGRRFKNEMPGQFQTGLKFSRLFSVYTAGDDLESLKLGIFTRWPAAAIYETGGVIRPEGRWLAFPVNPKAFTARGRIKRAWRDPANAAAFNPEKFKGLVPIEINGGRARLLVKPGRSTRAGRSGRVKATGRGGVGKLRDGDTPDVFEPMFTLIRQTRREGVLNFFDSFARQAGPRGRALQDAVNSAAAALAAEKD